MGNSIYISQKRKMRSNKQKTETPLKLSSAVYIKDFIIALNLSQGKDKFTHLIDFLPLFQQYVKGDNLKYYAPQSFKKFIVKDNNIYWGKNEDVIFSLDFLLNKNSKNNKEEEVLFVI
jgi:hypothetical protein